MTLLAIETSCDETSVAVVRGGRALSSVVSSQIKLHSEYGGVVPELAAREHLRNLMPVTRAALEGARVKAGELDAIAATQGPGLPNALLLGFKAAQGMAFALRKPFIGVNHHEAHLYSPWINAEASGRRSSADAEAAPGSGGGREEKDLTISNLKLEISNRENPPPYAGGYEAHGTPGLRADFEALEANVSLIVSGGHTMLVWVKSELVHEVLGSTIDDAAGECFDKVAKMIGLPYPGGPEIDRLAAEGNAKAYDFPRPMLREAGDDFSFSGLKTSARYFIRDHPEVLEDGAKLRDLCASVQAAIVEVLVAKTMRAALRLGVGCVTASGGVTCNRALRSGLEGACRRERMKLRLADRSLCTDNAAMIGILAERKLLKGEEAVSVDADILPGWMLI